MKRNAALRAVREPGANFSSSRTTALFFQKPRCPKPSGSAIALPVFPWWAWLCHAVHRVGERP